jgi:hypothetical protein
MMFWDMFLFIFFRSNIRELFSLPFCASEWLEIFWTRFLNMFFYKKLYKKYTNLFSFALF